MRRLLRSHRVEELARLRKALQGCDGAALADAIKDLGRQAATDGWSWRFILDIARGRLAIPPETAADALGELARLKPEIVIALLRNADPGIGSAAVIALGRDAPRFNRDLLALAEETEVSARLTAVIGLTQAAAHESEEAVGKLGALTADPDGRVRWAAAAALGQARGKSCVRRALALLEQLSHQDEAALSGAAFGATALYPACHDSVRLFLRLTKGSPMTRRAVAIAIRELPASVGYPLANPCVRDDDPDTRALAISALGQWAIAGSKKSLSHLRLYTRDPHPVVRAAVAKAMASHPELCPDGLIEQMALDSSLLVRSAVATGLGEHSSRAEACSLRLRSGQACPITDILLKLAKDKAAWVRAAAVTSLGRHGLFGPVQEACLDRTVEIRAAAIAALRTSQDTSVGLLLDLSRDRDARVVRAAASALSSHSRVLDGPVGERLWEIASNGATAQAGAEAIAATLDRAPSKDISQLVYKWPVKRAPVEIMWQVARAAQKPMAAEIVRALARIMENKQEPAEALQDASISFLLCGRRKLAKVFSWLHDCASALSVEMIAELGSSAPVDAAEEIKWLVSISRTVGRAVKSHSTAARAYGLNRAKVHVKIALLCNKTELSWIITKSILQRWRGILAAATDQEERAEINARLISRCIVANDESNMLLIEVGNRGPGEVTGISIQVKGALDEQSIPELPPGASVFIEVECTASPVGPQVISGSVQFRDASGPRSQAFAGEYEVVAAKSLEIPVNPFVVGKPLSEGSSMFFGRAAEMDFIERAIESGESGTIVALVGERRTGKTSLLKQLRNRLGYRYHVTFVDVQGMMVANTDAFFRVLANQLLPEHYPARESNGAHLVEQVSEQCERQVVLLLDEFDDLEQKVRSGRLSPEIFSQLRYLMQHCNKIKFVLAGTHRLQELAREYWSFLFNLAVYCKIGCLERSAAEALLRVPLHNLGIVCDDTAIARVLALAGEHPYLMQMLGYHLVEQCVALGEGAVTIRALERAVARLLESGDIHLRYLWDRAGPEGQLVIKTLADQPVNRSLKREELSTATHLNPARLARGIENLLSCEVVGEKAGHIYLRIGLHKYWLQEAEGSPGFSRPD